jgi:hypothetical protein
MLACKEAQNAVRLNSCQGLLNSYRRPARCTSTPESRCSMQQPRNGSSLVYADRKQRVPSATGALHRKIACISLTLHDVRPDDLLLRQSNSSCKFPTRTRKSRRHCSDRCQVCPYPSNSWRLASCRPFILWPHATESGHLSSVSACGRFTAAITGVHSTRRRDSSAISLERQRRHMLMTALPSWVAQEDTHVLLGDRRTP